MVFDHCCMGVSNPIITTTDWSKYGKFVQETDADLDHWLVLSAPHN